MYLKRIFRRLTEQDKKLLVKVIAGVILLAAALTFYLLKEMTADRESAVTLISESGAEDSLKAEGADAGTSGGAVAPASADSAEEEATIMVDVAGAVVNPSVVELPEGSRVFEAIEKAGGLAKDADTGLINRAETLFDGEKIYIPTKQEVKDNLNGRPPATVQYTTGVSNTGSSQSKLININTADSETLQQLTGVGPVTAGKIIDYRNSNGKFESVEDIKNVSGIGEKTFEKFKDQITI